MWPNPEETAELSTFTEEIVISNIFYPQEGTLF